MRIFRQCTIWIAMLIASATWVQAQRLGGQASMEFVRRSPTAMQSGLGGSHITTSLHDVNLVLDNPALLTDSLNGQLSMNYQWYAAGIGHSQAAYAREMGKAGMFALGLQQISYGEFEAFDPTGTALGTFRANDFMLTLSHSRQSGPFSIGLNLMLVQSAIEDFRATALMFSLGGAFIHPEKDLRIGLTVNHLGLPLRTYTPGESFQMPLDLRMGFTFKPERMPVRFSVTMQRLNHLLNLAANDPATAGQTSLFGQSAEPEISFADKLSRHFVIGGEFVLTKQFNARLGYNFLTRRELKLEQQPGLSGFAFGFMFKVKQFEFAFSRSIFQPGGGSTAVTILADTRTVGIKKRVIE